MLNLVWFDDIQGDMIKYTGGKGASLSKMHKFQLPVPNGFSIAAPFFITFLQRNNLDQKILTLIKSINFDDFNSIDSVSEIIRKMITDTPMPHEFKKDVEDYYNQLGGDAQAVAVRSSSTAEDLDDASFAGQLETYLYVIGKDDLIDKIKQCWASLYNGRAIFYRKEKGFDEKAVSISVVVQKMVNAEKAGVMFTVNPINKARNEILVEAAWGLGEAVVSGLVTPDNYVVNKTNYEVINEYISEKEVMVIRDLSMKGVREVAVAEDLREARVLADDEMKKLVDLANKLEAFYGKPQDIEWATEKGEIYLLQSRPISTLG